MPSHAHTPHTQTTSDGAVNWFATNNDLNLNCCAAMGLIRIIIMTSPLALQCAGESGWWGINQTMRVKHHRCRVCRRM